MEGGSGPKGLRKTARARLHRKLLAGTAAAILLGGVTASVFGALAWRSAVESQASRAFASTASAAASALALSLQRDADLAATARTLVQTTPTVSTTRFATWFRLLGTHETYPGSFGLLYVDVVPSSALHSFARRVTADPPLGLSTTGPFDIEPRGAPAPYCLVRAASMYVLASMHLQPQVLMALLSFVRPTLDFCQPPIGTALGEAAHSGRPVAMTLSSVLTNLRPGNGIPPVPASLGTAVARDGLITMVTPIRHLAPTREHGREASVTSGWVISIYQAGSILAPVLHDHRTMSAGLWYKNPNGSRLLLARAGPTRPVARAASTDWRRRAAGRFVSPSPRRERRRACRRAPSSLAASFCPSSSSSSPSCSRNRGHGRSSSSTTGRVSCATRRSTTT